MSSKSEYNKAYYQKNKERLKEAARKYYYENKEACRARSRAWYYANIAVAQERSHRWHEENRERVLKNRKANARRRVLAQHGLTEDQYNEMVEAQDGVCAICERPCDVAGKLSVDHCHETSRVRGLLCKRCNSGLGFFREDIDLLARALAYLANVRIKPEVT